MRLDPQTMACLEGARQRIFEEHRHDLNFTGCAIGSRRRGGRPTGEPVVIAMVAKKRPEGLVSTRRLLPRTVQAAGRECGVDVVEVGPVKANGIARPQGPSRVGVRPDMGGPIPEKFRPPLQGCSLSTLVSPHPTGTMGCLVKDLSDDSVCILSSNHVLALVNQAAIGDTIVQPSVTDSGQTPGGVAKLTRFVTLSAAGTNYVDAAIAKLDRQTAYSEQVARGLMAPISQDHPAVGMVVASDSSGNCFLSRMDHVVSLLNIKLLPATSSSSCVVAPEIDMHIEKVGRTSGYTSSSVDALAAQVTVDFGGGTEIVMSDMIWSQAFNLTGDSGAVACEGGNGHTFAPPPSNSGGCALLSTTGTYFDIPLSGDNGLTDEFQDKFLAQSLTGNLLIALTYANSATAIGRMKGKTAPSVEQAYAQEYYDKYHAIMKTMLANPTSTSPIITEKTLNDISFILAGLAGSGGVPPLLTSAEATAANTLYKEVFTKMKGMDYQQAISYMNEPAVYHKVRNVVSGVPTIELTSAISAD